MSLTPAELNLIKLQLVAAQRAPLASELQHWREQLESGATLAELADSAFPGLRSLPGETLIAELYRRLFDKVGDREGTAYWQERLEHGETPISLALSMLNAGLAAPDGTPGKSFAGQLLQAGELIAAWQSQQHIDLSPADLQRVAASPEAAGTLIARVQQAVERVAPLLRPGDQNALLNAAFAGDFDGDRQSDIVLGAAPFASAPAQAMVVSQGAVLTIVGGAARPALSAIGDINGDGLDDLLMSFAGTRGTTADSYLILGRSGNASIRLDALDPADGRLFPAVAPGALTAAGDTDGDGRSEVRYVTPGVVYTLNSGEQGGAGNELFLLSDLQAKVAGGAGHDLVKLAGGGLLLALGDLVKHWSGVEALDLAGSNGNVLTLNAADLPGGSFIIDGNGADLVEVLDGSGWKRAEDVDGRHQFVNGEVILLVAPGLRIDFQVSAQV